jgi:hypothetical protein
MAFLAAFKACTDGHAPLFTSDKLAAQPSRPPAALRHEHARHAPGQGQPSPLIILRVRALVPDKVKLSDAAQRTVRATVLRIDEELNQMKVQTVEGQQFILYLDPASRARLYVGAPYLLQVAQQSMQDFLQSSEHGEAFW